MDEIMMNKLKITILFALITTLTFAQKSPRKQANGNIGDVVIAIDYGAPSVRDRTIWGELVKYDKVWRAGANENTTISFDKNVKTGNKTIPAGKYGFFIIPKKNEDWVIILNKKNDAWGANGYNKEKDILRLNISPKYEDNSTEILNYSIDNKGIVISWANVKILIPIE